VGTTAIPVVTTAAYQGRDPQVILRIDGNVTTFNSSQFISSLSRILAISISRILIESIEAGSVIIKFVILPPPVGSTEPLAVDAVMHLQMLVASNDPILEAQGINVRNIVVHLPPQESTQAPVQTSNNAQIISSGGIAGIVIGGAVLFIVIIIAIVMISRRKHGSDDEERGETHEMKITKKADVSDETSEDSTSEEGGSSEGSSEGSTDSSSEEGSTDESSEGGSSDSGSSGEGSTTSPS